MMIFPSNNIVTDDQIRESIPAPNTLSVFTSDEETHTATIRGRGKSSKSSTPTGIPTFYSPNVKSLSSSTPDLSKVPKRPIRTGAENQRLATRSRFVSPGYRSSFLSKMVEETDSESRCSDHIYEELPSIPSSPDGSTPSPETSLFAGASKYEIIQFLQNARNRVSIDEDDNEELSNVS